MNKQASHMDRNAIRREYRAFVAKIVALLFEADPMGINLGSNSDEYAPEAGTIIPRLSSAQSVEDVEKIVYEEFCRWFGEDSAGSIEGYKPISAAIWQKWVTYKKVG